MRLRFILSLFMAFFIGSAVNAHTLDEPPYEPVLEGELNDDYLRSLSEIPIHVLIYEDNASIEFTKAVGDIKISIKSGGKEVYSSTINIQACGETSTISLTGYTPGTYLIEFTTPKGGYVYGWFTVE